MTVATGSDPLAARSDPHSGADPTSGHDPQSGRRDRGRGSSVRVLAEDPGLGELLDPAAFAAASSDSVARVVRLPAWPAGGVVSDAPPGSLGLLVLDGMLARSVTVERRTWTELIAAGDLIRPWHRERERHASVPGHAEWRVLSPLRLAILDHGFAVRMGHWPEVMSVLADRLVARTRSLTYALAVTGRVSVADRVELTLRDYADRWGRVSAAGITVWLPGLTHALLASLVGAARPSVTSALGVLAQRGSVQRTDEETWLVSHQPSLRG